MILKPSDLSKYPAKNSKGEWATYIDGVFQGYHPMVAILSGGNWILVPVHIAPIFNEMVADAAKDGVKLTAERCFSTMETQLFLRKKNVIDKTKVNDLEYLLSKPVDGFSPWTGIPGHSNHQNIKFSAIDWNVTKTDKNGNRIGNLPSYPWLVQNAFRYDMIRTIPKERWHWEHRPGFEMFSKVPKDHPTWDGLVI